MNRKIRGCWEAGRAAVNFWLSMPGTVHTEIAARADLDALTVDLQHGLIDYNSALPMLQAMSLGTPTPMARVPWLEPGIIMKLLDAGALGIICPMINTPQEASRLVGYCRYAPDGERSFGPTRALPLYGPDYPSRANETLIVLAMVETRQALENVTEIAATPGLTGIYIGPSDLALSLGCAPKLDHDDSLVLEAIENILNAAKSAGVRAGIHCAAPGYAKRMIELGFDLVTVSSDVRLLTSALTATLGEMRS